MLSTVSDILTDAGHNVTVVIPIIDETYINKTGLKSTKNVIFVEQDGKVRESMGKMRKMLKNLWYEGSNPLQLIGRKKPMAELFGWQCKKVLESKELLEYLEYQDFDLGITEPFDSCGYYVFDKIKLRAHVSLLTVTYMDHVNQAIGLPMASSYIPATHSYSGDRMNIIERLQNTLLTMAGAYMFAGIGDFEQQFYRERSWRDILPESTFIFTNSIPFLDFPTTKFDQMIPIGGISVKTSSKNHKLESKWNEILNIQKKNVYISFGSNILSIDMPNEYKQSLLNVFKSMPDVTFIWKYEDEKDTLADHLDNVYLGSWLPQNELLADPRLSLFMVDWVVQQNWLFLVNLLL